MKALDREEKQILSVFEVGKLKSTVTSKASLRRYREYAGATLRKNKGVNIRLSTLTFLKSKRVPQKRASPIKC